MTQMERKTQEQLGDVMLMDKQISVLQTQLEQLEYDIQKAERYAALYGAANEEKIARFHAINAALREGFLREITRLNETKAAVYNTLSAIPDESVRVVMMERYLNGKTWEDIAEDNIYGLSTVYRMHQRGLRAVAALSHG